MGHDTATGNHGDVGERDRKGHGGGCIAHLTVSRELVRLSRGRQPIPEDVDPVAESHPRPDRYDEACPGWDAGRIEYASDRVRHLWGEQHQRLTFHRQGQALRQAPFVDGIEHTYRTLAQRGDLVVGDRENQDRRKRTGYLQGRSSMLDRLA
ncbi:hypothetical protein D3C77_331940 [compost metagenome]